MYDIKEHAAQIQPLVSKYYKKAKMTYENMVINPSAFSGKMEFNESCQALFYREKVDEDHELFRDHPLSFWVEINNETPWAYERIEVMVYLMEDSVYFQIAMPAGGHSKVYRHFLSKHEKHHEHFIQDLYSILASKDFIKKPRGSFPFFVHPMEDDLHLMPDCLPEFIDRHITDNPRETACELYMDYRFPLDTLLSSQFTKPFTLNGVPGKLKLSFWNHTPVMDYTFTPDPEKDPVLSEEETHRVENLFEWVNWAQSIHESGIIYSGLIGMNLLSEEDRYLMEIYLKKKAAYVTLIPKQMDLGGKIQPFLSIEFMIKN